MNDLITLKAWPLSYERETWQLPPPCGAPPEILSNPSVFARYALVIVCVNMVPEGLGTPGSPSRNAFSGSTFGVFMIAFARELGLGDWSVQVNIRLCGEFVSCEAETGWILQYHVPIRDCEGEGEDYGLG